MSMIKGSNTKPELIVRRYLHSKGFRYTLNNKKLPGKPDIVLKKYSTAIFVHGCFWHGHKTCKYYKLPKTNTSFWEDKINKNVTRDMKKELELLSKGWNVITVWECEIKNQAFKKHVLEKINDFLLKLS